MAYSGTRASGSWAGKQKRHWMSLDVEETPGSFRRLNEDEARRSEWPPATLPSSLNGQVTGAKKSSSSFDKGEGAEGDNSQSDSPRKTGSTPLKEKDGARAKSESDKKKASSLPRPKRDGKPSLFTALTWSKGKKFTPKHPEADDQRNAGKGPEPERAQTAEAEPGVNANYSERAVDVPDKQASSTERAARLPRPRQGRTSANSSNSSSSSSGGSSSSSNKSGQNKHPPPVKKKPEAAAASRQQQTLPAPGGKKTAAQQKIPTPEKKKTPPREAPPASGKDRKGADVRGKTTAASAAATPAARIPENGQPGGAVVSSTKIPAPAARKPKGVETRPVTSKSPTLEGQKKRKAGEEGSVPKKAERRPREGESRGGEEANAKRAESEASRGETYFDTGRTFRLEATVMVDDEKPAERRVTYLGPVLLSPLGQRQGHYVHVTVAPGSGVEASEGSSLLVRPAMPVLIHSNSKTGEGKASEGEEMGTALTMLAREKRSLKRFAPLRPEAASAKGENGSGKQTPTTDNSARPDSEAKSEKVAGPRFPAEKEASSFVLAGAAPVDRRGGADETNREVAEIMEKSEKETKVEAVELEVPAAARSEHYQEAAQEEPFSTGDRCDRRPSTDLPPSVSKSDDGGRGACQARGDSLPVLDKGEESVMVMREDSEVYAESVPSPIPVDESVFGTTSASPTQFATQQDSGKTEAPEISHENINGSNDVCQPESAVQHTARSKGHRRNSSTASSSSSSSSTSSADSESKRKRHDLVSPDEEDKAEGVGNSNNSSAIEETESRKNHIDNDAQVTSPTVVKPDTLETEAPEKSTDIQEQLDSTPQLQKSEDFHGFTEPSLSASLDQQSDQTVIPEKPKLVRLSQRLPPVGKLTEEDLRPAETVKDKPRRMDSFGRPRPELLDPHVFLASDEGKRQKKPTSRDTSSAAENRCDHKVHVTAGLHRPDAEETSLPLSETTTLPSAPPQELNDVSDDFERYSLFEPYVVSVTEHSTIDSEDQKDVSSSSLSSAHDREPILDQAVIPDVGHESLMELKMNQNEASPVNVPVVEEPVLRLSIASRPQKPARTSIAKEDVAPVTGEPPLDTSVDRPPLPLKGTPRASSSSSSASSSHSSDSEEERKAPAAAAADTDVPRAQDSEKLPEDALNTTGSERFYSPQSFLDNRDTEGDTTSSANSSQFITDTSLAEQVDLPNFEDVKITLTADARVEETVTGGAPDKHPGRVSSSSSSTSRTDHSGSTKSESSSKSGKKDVRKPPVFMTPPPPPTKPVRTCGSQSDLSDKSGLDHDLVVFTATPPKPVRTPADRLSPFRSDGEKKKSKSRSSASSSSSCSEAGDGTKPPVLPPRREKLQPKGHSQASPPQRPRSEDSSARKSFTSSDEEGKRSPRPSKGDSGAASTPKMTARKADEKAKLPAIPTQSLDDQSATFVPYEDSGIYYTPVTQREQKQDLDSSKSSSTSTDHGKKGGTSPKARKSDKSFSSSEDAKKPSGGPTDPPPVPPRHKAASRKAASDLNSSTSSSGTSRSSRSPRSDRRGVQTPNAKLPQISHTTIDPAEHYGVLDAGSDTVPKLPDSPDVPSAKCHLDVPDTVQPELESELSLQKEVADLNAGCPFRFQGIYIPNSEVKLPLKPRTPSPRTPSPKPPRTPSPNPPRTPSPNPPRTPSPKLPRTPSPKPPESPLPASDAQRTPSPARTPSPVTPRAQTTSQSESRPTSTPGDYERKVESAQHTDEDRPEADSAKKKPLRRAVSAGSTTSATSHDDDAGDKKSSKSKLRKYWPFRRRKGEKKDAGGKKRKDNEEEVMHASTPHLPLHHSTPNLERHTSDSHLTTNKATPEKSPKHRGAKKKKPGDSDTSTLSESANEQGRKPTKAERILGLSTSTSSAEHSSEKGKKAEKGKKDEKGKKEKAPKDSKKDTKEQQHTEDAGRGSSRDATPTPASAEKKPKKAAKHKEEKKSGGKERPPAARNGGKTNDTSTSSSSASSSKTSSEDKKKAAKEDPAGGLCSGITAGPEAPLTPPRVTSPLREGGSPQPSYPVPSHPSPQDVQHPRFDGEFQRLDEDIQADAEAAMATAMVERRPPIVVVAVDLGTTHSGYAFSFSRDPGSVYVMSRWAGQEPGLLNHKTLSALLLTPDARFHSFGLAARNHYHNLLPIEARHWLYFERFKMTLHHSKELSRDTMVAAVNGTQLPALTVFAHVLEFFATHALQQLSDQSGTEFRRQDVRWVVTVPAIWREPAKQLMRQAAMQGGMFTRADPSQLLIVLEPEAASIYCRRLRMHQLMPEVGTARPLHSPRRSMDASSNVPAVSNLVVDGSKSTESLDSLSEPTLESKVKGTRYVVVDCGGGTVDITVHELSDSGQLIELHRATGGPHGSTGVDAEFEALLCSIFGSDFVDNYKRQFPVGWVNLMTDFESRKRAASPFKTTSFNVSLPFTFISEFRKHKGEVEQALKRYGDPSVEWSLQGMLRLAPPAMHRLFASVLVSIRQAVGDVLNHPNTRDLKYLFLVGGFAESPLLQHEIRREFGHLLTVLIPQDVSLAVLRGAVLFGLDPKVVSVRCARLTYGVGILNRFDPDRHPVHKRVRRDGVDWCTDVFDRFVAINQPVSLGTNVTRRYAPARAGQKLIVLNIYSSSNPAPGFITDQGVRKCGTLYLDLHDTDSQSSLEAGEGGEEVGMVEVEDQPREILVSMAFGDTEISVKALDIITGRQVQARADFLSG